MTQLHLLLLPILFSSVLVFLVSSVIHMFSPWHKNDYPRLSIEDKIIDALRPLDIPPGVVGLEGNPEKLPPLPLHNRHLDPELVIEPPLEHRTVTRRERHRGHLHKPIH